MSFKSWILTFILAVVVFTAVAVFAPAFTSQKPTEPTPAPPQHSGKIEIEPENKDSGIHSSSHFAPTRSDSNSIPYFMDEGVLSASFKAMEKHGADLSKPMPSTHRVRCQSQEAIDRVGRWAESAGFEVSKPELVHLHGGIENFMLDLVKTQIPDVSSIQNDGRRIASAAHRIEGVTYSTWVGAIVK